MSITIVLGVVVLGLSYTHDASGTIKLVTAIITIRGITWLCKKVTSTINFDCGQIIDFTGWTFAGVSIIKVLSNAKMEVEPLLGKLGEVNTSIANAGSAFSKLAEIADKITFWN